MNILRSTAGLLLSRPGCAPGTCEKVRSTGNPLHGAFGWLASRNPSGIGPSPITPSAAVPSKDRHTCDIRSVPKTPPDRDQEIQTRAPTSPTSTHTGAAQSAALETHDLD